MSSSGSGSRKAVVLKSCDGQTFEVDEMVAAVSPAIKRMIMDNPSVTSVPLSNVTGKILGLVLKYCERHLKAAAKTSADQSGFDDYLKAFDALSMEAAGKASADGSEDDDDLKAFDAEFVNVDQGTLFDLMLAGHYLDIKSLVNLTCQAVANMMKGKTPEEIRRIFNIKNDYTPEEEAEIRREVPWAFM